MIGKVLVLIIILLWISYYDLKHKIIKNYMQLIIIIVGFIINSINFIIIGFNYNFILLYLIVIILGYNFMMISYRLKIFSGGDSKLLLSISILLNQYYFLFIFIFFINMLLYHLFVLFYIYMFKEKKIIKKYKKIKYAYAPVFLSSVINLFVLILIS